MQPRIKSSKKFESVRTVTCIDGVRVGHASSISRRTGCTVMLFRKPAVVAHEARGGWPGTYDTDSIGMGKTFFRKNAIFLTGGDVFGLNCAAGIQRYLLEERLASSRKAGLLPGVVGANIFDLDFGRDISNADYSMLGYKASKNAKSDPVKQGNYGAGTGATVGKLRGFKHAMKGGIGSSCSILPPNIRVGAIVVTNAVGNIIQKASIIAGTRPDTKNRGVRFIELEEITDEYGRSRKYRSSRSKATTIGIIVTDLKLSHENCLKIAEMAHDGLARSIRPSHLTTDGDTLFCASTEQKSMEVTNEIIDIVGHMAANEVEKSVISSVTSARATNGLPSYRSSSR